MQSKEEKKRYFQEYYRKNKEKILEQSKEYYFKNKDSKKETRKEYYKTYNKLARVKTREWGYNKNYGITIEKYNSMLETQKGVCAICGNPETVVDNRTKQPKNLAVDHCHTTGKVRGLLCYRCNTSLGKFEDSKNLLLKAIAYLDKE